MSNAIQFLEGLGCKPMLAAGVKEYAASISLLGIDEGQRQALLDRKAAELSRLLGGREVMRMAVAVPDLEQSVQHEEMQA